jgi:hypothetical protein
MRGEPHRKREKGETGSQFFCSSCNVRLSGDRSVEEHVAGSKHKKRIAGLAKGGIHGGLQLVTPDVVPPPLPWVPGGSSERQSSAYAVAAIPHAPTNAASSLQSSATSGSLGGNHLPSHSLSSASTRLDGPTAAPAAPRPAIATDTVRDKRPREENNKFVDVRKLYRLLDSIEDGNFGTSPFIRVRIEASSAVARPRVDIRVFEEDLSKPSSSSSGSSSSSSSSSNSSSTSRSWSRRSGRRRRSQ